MPPKILIIDDDSSLRRVLEYNLQQEGYDVYTAADGAAGLQLFEEKSPQLVITDLKMPGMTGFEVLSSVKERAPSTVVIVLTAFGAIDTAVEAMKLGAFHYLTKPFNREELKVTVLKGLQLQGLSEENRLLKEELSGRSEFKSIVGTSRAMEGVFSVVRKVADTEATVLITGESGTGKELVARAIHSGSSRRAAPFIAVNCAAIPRDLLESELFGHVKGAFTGAIRDKEGKFQLADGGTIFLDEVGDLPIELQPKLLRVLQERVVEPVGGTSLQKIDLRVVAATNADLERWIAEGKFREDLYYRLSVIPIQLPPLRERVEDVPLLIRYFCTKFGAEGVSFTKEALARLKEYAWPGNVRELENTVERLLIMREGDLVGVDELPAKISAAAPPPEGGVLRLPAAGYSLEQLEMEVVLEALNRCDWNQTAAARFLRIPRHTLIYRMEKYNISQPGRK
ncbi:sigma-54-dependent transcriptional regulator [Geomonas propionica]|uniref:Sigma-54-dependent Fis family transcriptional regulator n=1 Tax=Geomonas propionica TaxID=2798582 RepID=A0ABS0YY43_9BACT|nr:sigma-54 dependent transcriptional regulator [Geomonas propionica]MBJ6802415.1 sigma-54-dependent Fis family transcriptional regulator [Geomonas propionica]